MTVGMAIPQVLSTEADLRPKLASGSMVLTLCTKLRRYDRSVMAIDVCPLITRGMPLMCVGAITQARGATATSARSGRARNGAWAATGGGQLATQSPRT
jgi:hypothetical protein